MSDEEARVSVYLHTQARRVVSSLNKKLCSGRGREKLANSTGVVKASESEGEKRGTSIRTVGRAEHQFRELEEQRSPWIR